MRNGLLNGKLVLREKGLSEKEAHACIGYRISKKQSVLDACL